MIKQRFLNLHHLILVTGTQTNTKLTGLAFSSLLLSPDLLCDTIVLFCIIRFTCAFQNAQFNFSKLIFRENTVKVEAFVRTDDDCKQTCSDNNLCGYYKHFPSEDEKQPLVIYYYFFFIKLYTNVNNVNQSAS